LVQFHQASDRKRQEIGLAGDHLETGANAVNFVNSAVKAF
jgi:hypothetical protein